MIKRFIFTSLLLLLNAASVGLLFSAPLESETLLIAGFFFFLLVAYIISLTKAWHNTLHSNRARQAVLIIMVLIVIPAIFISCCYELYTAISTAEITPIRKHWSSFRYTNFRLNQENSPWLFWINFSIYLTGVIGILLGYWKYAFKEAINVQTNESVTMGNPENQTPIASIVDDLELPVNLLTETSSASELKEKTEPLFASLELKYKEDDIAKSAIQDAKHYILAEIKKRTENESKTS